MGSCGGRSLSKVVALATAVMATTISTGARASSGIAFSDGVPADQVSVLQNDLRGNLGVLDDATLKSVMGTSDLTDRGIKAWLGDRVKIVIGESEQIEANVVKLQDNYTYPNAGIMPDMERPAVVSGGEPVAPLAAQAQPSPMRGQVVTVMSNMGAGLYMVGKQARILLGYRTTLNGAEDVVALKSPRAGLIQIGEGLFSIVPNKTNAEAMINTYFRMGTFLHEAHHGDGNAKSLSFAHAVCPKGHAYYNYNACDRNGNGPYAVGANYAKQARATCVKNKTCTAGEAELMATEALDSQSRILDSKFWDAAPEGT